MTEFAPEEVAKNRRDLHGAISPAVQSADARQELIPRIEAMSIPVTLIRTPLVLAKQRQIVDTINADSGSYCIKASQAAGTHDVIDNRIPDIYRFGFGDRYVTTLFAGEVGQDIERALFGNGTLQQSLSLAEYARLFKTEWFGDLINSVALTARGILQPAANEMAQRGGGSYFYRAFGYSDVPYEFSEDPETGLLTGRLTRETTAMLRSYVPRSMSVGCPVARTAFTTTEVQAAFLEEHGHIGDSSGFVRDEQLTASGRVKFTRPDGKTAINDVLGAWSGYVERYVEEVGGWFTGQPNPVGADTGADQVLLLAS